MTGKQIVEENTKSAEYWKDKAREVMGENVASLIVNTAITVAADGMNGTVAMVDTAGDLLAALVTCATGENYCTQAKSDLKETNDKIGVAFDAVVSGNTWEKLKQTINAAEHGDQKAQENISALLASLLVPAKAVYPGGKTGGTVNKVENVASDASTVNKIENSVSDINKIEKINTTSVVVEYGPLNKGPLPEKIAETFRSGTYKEVITTDTTSLYRVYGGNSKELGPYRTTEKPSGPVQSIIDSALEPKWGNTATKVVEIKVPAGIKFYEGIAAKQSGLVGGGNQIFFIDKVDPSWIVK
ncbi:hypothetical protein GCM10023211_09220 [Orbus sasakiae]|uniref:Uncharacterized protein n=1 Tax=Orbus sasakiae TaxID=1078475 RepID=A0ABP9N4F9_9GAMM